MLPVSVQGPLDARAWVDLDAAGCPGIAVAVKAGFRGGDAARLRLDDDTPALETAERYAGDPAAHAPLTAPDCVPFKHGAECLLHGAVQVGPGRSQAAACLGVEDAGGRPRFGPKRVWAVAEPPPRASDPPGALEGPVPLTYELAYGGPLGGPRHRRYARNPVGRGHRAAWWGAAAGPSPRLLWDDHRATRRGAPAGFGPLAAAWAPRARRFGRLDAHAYRQGQLRYRRLPRPDAWNAAPADQCLDTPLCGDERIRLQGVLPGVDPDHTVIWQLPGGGPQVTLHRPGRGQRVTVQADTLGIDADAGRVWLVWRGWVPEPAPGPGWALRVDADGIGGGER
ncbi:DUF2169 family type VI secretion system accessory protein [Halorhodospira halophila]|uniref:DUF2169 domain-containing protein n=1 Tax=Halorhodospira halophila (strain DSM 244 / SL1) TaxID=349124 RepID=A1WVJ4_HALHL|nr:DUF2169 domain-containing protein [Halorhodospira halophila]ABM61706.1 conserved hypothetical protein [Halorhodospira halophila SL1]MBK1728964.1 DUF2169 domain-containing protein [Halorhodospira halophila]